MESRLWVLVLGAILVWQNDREALGVSIGENGEDTCMPYEEEDTYTHVCIGENGLRVPRMIRRSILRVSDCGEWG